MVISSAVLIVVAVLISAFLLTSDSPSSIVSSAEEASFYVGVTYCGSSTAEAKLLIDRVKIYTNLFVLQSGKLQENMTATVDICDYAVNSGLSAIVYFGSYSSNREVITAFLRTIGNRWGSHFLGFYFGDEPGGKMLDSEVEFREEGIYKIAEGDLKVYHSTVNLEWSEHYVVTYKADGTIVKTDNGTSTFYPNGTVLSVPGTRRGSVAQNDTSKFDTYQILWDSRPLKTYDQAAELFVAGTSRPVEWLHSQTSSKVFTSDYGLYWWDYLGGYDVVLAQLGWNNTVAQEIGLVRGAANLQNKQWGTIITWKYTQEPYLADGQEIYEQMRAGKLNNCFSVVDALLLAGVYALRCLRTVSSRANIERGMTTGKRR